MPSSVRAHGAPGSLPGPHSRYQPASSSTAGSAQRPVPKYGTEKSRQPSVSAPCPGSSSAIAVTAPRTSRMIPISDRTTAGDSPSERLGIGMPPPFFRAGARRRVDEPVLRERVDDERRWATSDLDHDGEDHRAALRLLVQEAGHAVLDLALEQRDLADPVAGLVERLADPADRLLDHRVLLVAVDEPAGDD